jgi:ribosomal protein S4
MTIRIKNKKPLYKQFIALRENVQNRKKLLKFKKLKWKNLILSYKKRLKKYRKFKPQDHNKYLVSKYPSKNTSYKKRFRNTHLSTKRFKVFYGGLSSNYLKNLIEYLSLRARKEKDNCLNISFLEILESRLDVILYRSKFSPSIQNARQLIAHGKILVNKKEVKSKSYYLHVGDLISVKPDTNALIESNIKLSDSWPIPPKHLLINYKTMQIIFGKHKGTNFSLYFPFGLNLEQILNNIRL